MLHSKGFSFIEVVLILALSSIVILMFVQNITFSSKFLNTNPQVLFSENDAYLINRGIRATSNLIFSDLKNSVGKRDCSINNLQDFKNLTIPPYENINHGEVVSVSLLGNILLAGMNSATSSDPDVVIVDTTNWKIISSLNSGPGLAGMVLQGHYLYLANTSVNAQIQVVDIVNTLVPALVGSFKIPGSTSSNSKKNPIATSISSNINGRIFLGTQKSDLGEIFIVDFNGTNFSYINSYDTGSIVNDVFADGSGLWATSPSDNELLHYNSSGIKDYVFNANGQSGNGKRIDILGQDLKVLGRTFGHEELVQVDGPAQKIGGSINDVLINVDSNGRFSVLVLANINGVSVLQVWGTINTKLDKLLKSIVLPVLATRMTCGENTIFIGTSSSTAPFVILKT